MHTNHGHHDPRHSAFMSGINGLGLVLAIIACFFGTPPLYDLTVFWVAEFSDRYYGREWTDLIRAAWWLSCAAAIFFAARATLSTALTMAGLAIAARLFV